MSAVRTPPRPPFEGAPRRLRDGKLHQPCPMCGDVVPKGRAWWHPECAEAWRYAGFPADAARLMRELHGRACWACGTVRLDLVAMVRALAWREDAYDDDERRRGVAPIPRVITIAPEYEHVRPLWSLSDTERREIKWWLPFNLQMLCRSCHAAKTKREARDRADVEIIARTRKLAAQHGITIAADWRPRRDPHPLDPQMPLLDERAS